MVSTKVGDRLGSPCVDSPFLLIFGVIEAGPQEDLRQALLPQGTFAHKQLVWDRQEKLNILRHCVYQQIYQWPSTHNFSEGSARPEFVGLTIISSLRDEDLTLFIRTQSMQAIDPLAYDASLSMTGVVIIVVLAAVLGLVWAFISYLGVKKIDLKNGQQGEYENLNNEASEHQIKLLLQLGEKISQGAKEFLKQEYLVCIIFVGVMFFIIYGAVEKFEKAYTAFAFVIGAITSIACGAIGMTIATYTNYRVTFCAKRGLADAFRTAYRGGCVMGFALVSIALVTLLIVILIFKAIMGLDDNVTCTATGLDMLKCLYFQDLFESIAGYGLGGSTVALFGRVGGGIYTKAADVGADLVGKVEKDLPEDSPKNPATIADNVGDNVGDIAGMGADLFGSFAESTCAALVISSNCLFAGDGDKIWVTGSMSINNLMFPLTMVAFGIVVCLITSAIGIFVNRVDVEKKIESTLKYQIIISTVLLLGAIYLAAHISYPANFIFDESGEARLGGKFDVKQPYHAYLCAAFGLVSGMIIGGFTEYMTSHTYQPVRELAGSCRTGAATNVIYGLALGYLSTIVPVICIALTAYGSSKFLGYYGVALGALGMLSNLPIGLAIDGYGPISDNAGGIAEMAEMGEEVRGRTDALDAAGNTTAAIGKGFAIGSAALVALSLYGGFLHNAELTNGLSLTDSAVFAGLLIGAMLPYAFSAFTMKSVGKAALGMVEEIRRQIRENPGILTGTVEPDYKACIRISTRASLIEMIAPGCLVIFTPMLMGIAFGPRIIAGFLPGAIVSGVQLAISAANTGGAWDNAKKYIEGGYMIDDEGTVVKKGSDIHKAAVVGDTVGDPLKDTSGPSLNILIKLMAILSLVFASLFKRIHQ